MSRYIDWDDVAGRYTEAVKLAGNTDAGSYWMIHAENEVDARLAPRYAVPFTPPAPVMVQDLCIDLTYYKMSLRMEGADKLWAYLENRFTGLIDGTIALTTTAGIIGTGDLAVTANSYHTSFGPDSEVNWKVSSQWMGDVQSERGQTWR